MWHKSACWVRITVKQIKWVKCKWNHNQQLYMRFDFILMIYHIAEIGFELFCRVILSIIFEKWNNLIQHSQLTTYPVWTTQLCTQRRKIFWSQVGLKCWCKSVLGLTWINLGLSCQSSNTSKCSLWLALTYLGGGWECLISIKKSYVIKLLVLSEMNTVNKWVIEDILCCYMLTVWLCSEVTTSRLTVSHPVQMHWELLSLGKQKQHKSSPYAVRTYLCGYCFCCSHVAWHLGL